MKKNKMKNLFRHIMGILAPIAMIYLIKTGKVGVEKSSEAIIWVILILCPFLAIKSMIRDFKRDSTIETTNKLKVTELEKIKELKKKNENPLIHNFKYQTIIFVLLLSLVLILILNNLDMYWLIIIIPIYLGIMMCQIILSVNKMSNWYYNFDEFLYYKYQLLEGINKKEELAKMKEQIEEQKKFLKQRKDLNKIENKLFQNEEIEIRRIYSEMEALKDYNEYTKKLPDGSELRFTYTFLRRGRKKYIYNIKSTLYVERENLIPLEQFEEIINKHDGLKISIDDSGVIETEFASNLLEINYERLIDWISYSYEVCCQFLKYEIF